MTPSQLDLFQPPSQKHSPTSVAAAEAIKPHAETQRERVYALLKQRALTDQEMQQLLNLDPSTQRPRRRELQQLGLIYDTGRKRLTLSGRSAVVWKAVS